MDKTRLSPVPTVFTYTAPVTLAVYYNAWLTCPLCLWAFCTEIDRVGAGEMVPEFPKGLFQKTGKLSAETKFSFTLSLLQSPGLSEGSSGLGWTSVLGLQNKKQNKRTQ